MKALLADPRRRNLAVLAALAVVSVALAVFALEQRAAMVAPKYPPHSYFPGLAHAVSGVTHIHIASKKFGAFDVDFVPMKGWVLPGHGNYPASFPEVRKTIVGMAAMQTIEPKTARPDWFHYVDLDPPPKGSGILIELGNDKGKTVATLIAGKSQDIGDDSGAVGLFVRKPSDTQSWLVKSSFQPRADPADWIDKDVMNVVRGRIRETDVRPATGPAYSVSRATTKDVDFNLDSVPHGREIAYPGAADGVAGAISDFTFSDVKPSDDVDFQTGVSHLVTRTFDGLVVNTDVVKLGTDYWARVYADAEPGQPDAAKEANEINAHAAGWAYKLDPYNGALFATPLESLLKPKDKAKK